MASAGVTFGAIRMSGSLYFEYRPRGRPLWNVWLLTKIAAQCSQQDDLTAKCAITKGSTSWVGCSSETEWLLNANVLFIIITV